jgi:hypothetical protein
MILATTAVTGFLIGPPPERAAAALVATGIDDNLTTKHDRPRVVAAPGVLGNDLNLLGGASAILVSGVSHGTLTLRGDGGYTYTPTAGYVGADSFRYRPSGLLSTPATVRITVTNAAPVAAPDAHASVSGMTLLVAAPGVLGNDLDADGDALTAELVGGVASGALMLDPTGAFSYMPGGGFSGAVSFSYRVSDGLTWSVPAIVSMMIAPAPTPVPTPAPTPPPSTPVPTPAPPPPPSTPTPTPSPAPIPPPPTPPPAPGVPTPSPPTGGPSTPPPATSRPDAPPGAPPSGSTPPGLHSTSPDASSPTPEDAGGPPSSGGGGSRSRAQAPAADIVGAAGVDRSVSAPRLAIDQPGLDLDLTSLWLLGGVDVWAVPAATIAGPGLIVLLWVALQTGGVSLWIPAARRLRGEERSAPRATA